MGLGDKAEGAQVAQTYPSQDDVAELTTGRLDHRGVPKSTVRSQNSFKKTVPWLCYALLFYTQIC